jgi:hypothetical protein
LAKRKRWSVGDPIHARFVLQRGVAKARGIEWQLPYWEWLQIWQDSGHLHERGIHKGQWCMARNGDIGPYAARNVRIVRVEKNNSDANSRRRCLMWPEQDLEEAEQAATAAA